MKGKKKVLIILLLFFALALQISQPAEVKASGDKTFTVTKRPVGDTGEGTLVGEYDTFYRAIEACKQEDLSNQYVVTMNKDCNIPETEGAWGKSSVNILLKSREGHTFTLKRLGNRDIMTVYSKCTFRIENVILDGNGDGQACMVAGDADPKGANLILGKGAVIQNFKDTPEYLGTTFYLAEGNSILTIEDGAVLQNNTAEKSGGVIQARAKTTINIKGGLFKNNSSESGGGVIFTNGELNITGGTFEENVGKYGGALWIGSTSTANVENAIFKNNHTTKSYGGAIWASNGFKVKNSTFDGNKVAKTAWAGAIYGQKGMIIETCTFKDNEAYAGGALAIPNDVKMDVSDSTFNGNSAAFAGAIYMLTSTDKSTINSCTFTDNKATEKGGAIFSQNALSVTESKFNGNVAGSQGGAFYIKKGDLNIDKSQFTKNSSHTGGGAVFIAFDANNLTKVIDSKFSKNESPYGGGIYLGKDSKLQVEKSEFSGNQAAYGGGIVTSLGANIDKSKSSISINNSKFLENEALQGGGLLTAFPTQIKGSVFNKNKANIHPQDDQKNPHSSGLGGAIYVMDHQTDIQSTKFNENWAYGSGGALSISGWSRDDDGNISGIKTEILVNITNNTEFNGNIVEVGQGGAIYVNPYEYAYEITDKDAYTKLNTDNTTLFLKNMTKHRLFQPPKNYQKFSNLQFDKNSDVKHGILQVESLLNNYDVNYKNEYAIISFDPNGGSGKMDNQIVEFKEDEGKTGSYKLPENKFTPPEGQEFKGWEIDGKEYKVGDTITVDKNIVVKALWTKASNPQQPNKPTDTEVIGGDDRIDTAGKISNKYYSYADNVIIARKDDFPDALTASVLAKALNAPILLTDTNKLDERVASELKRLGIKKAYIIGRENAITEFTESQIKKITGSTERIGGSDRYETSSLVAKKVVSLVGKKGRAVVATGQNFADSLSISPYAAKMGYPILLLKQNKVPQIISKTIKDLSINEVYVVGGNSAVSVKLEKALPKLIKRIGGLDRYETSAKIADEFFINSKKAYMASGQVFADALVIGPVAANENAPVLLTMQNKLPKAIKANIDRVHYEKITIVGLENAVSKKVIEAIN